MYFFVIPTPTEIILIPIPIPMEMWFSFPFTWESHGNPIPTGNPIPMHTSTQQQQLGFFLFTIASDLENVKWVCPWLNDSRWCQIVELCVIGRRWVLCCRQDVPTSTTQHDELAATSPSRRDQHGAVVTPRLSVSQRCSSLPSAGSGRRLQRTQVWHEYEIGDGEDGGESNNANLAYLTGRPVVCTYETPHLTSANPTGAESKVAIATV